MTSRFKSIRSDKRYDGKQFYLTTLYPRIYPRSDDFVIVSKQTDRLDTLAYQFYKDDSLWWIIGKANRLGLGGLEIPEGLYLRIPRNKDYIISLFNQLNTT